MKRLVTKLLPVLLERYKAGGEVSDAERRIYIRVVYHYLQSASAVRLQEIVDRTSADGDKRARAAKVDVESGRIAMPRSVHLTMDFPTNDKELVAWSRLATTTQNGADALKIFPNLPVLAAQMNPLTDAVSSADQVVDTRVRGAKPARTSARNDCEAAHRKNASYCEGIVNGLPADQQDNAVAHSGYGQKGKRKAGKAAHSAHRAAVAGEAIVDIKAVGRHGTIQYVHAYSINNGQTWVELPPTLDAHITVQGLPVGTTVLFRWRTLLDGAYGDWSPNLPYQVT